MDTLGIELIILGTALLVISGAVAIATKLLGAEVNLSFLGLSLFVLLAGVFDTFLTSRT